MRVNTLSGRFAALTIIFVLLAEVLILLPALANYRVDYLESRLERAQIASLAVLATDQMLASDLEKELVETAGVYNVVLNRYDVRQLVLSQSLGNKKVVATYDLRQMGFVTSLRQAVQQLFDTRDVVIRILGAPVNEAGESIEITMGSLPLQKAMADFALRLLVITTLFSILTAILLNVAAQRLILVPMRRVINHMTAYASAPEDARLIITPDARLIEINEAEAALAAMQRTVTSSLKQKERMAGLGQAVAKISHDLRNILTTAQIFADRLEESGDPKVRRAAPKLVNSISRAVNLCETTLAFGRAEEPAPMLSRFALLPLAAEVIEAEALAGQSAPAPVEFVTDVPPTLTLRADRDQLYRVLSNLVRNARQAIEGTGQPGTIELGAGESDAEWWIRVGDTGPGLPPKAREFLFKPFTGSARKGGTGLGLSIASDLIRGHGGRLQLLRSDEEGSEFMVHIPRDVTIVPTRLATAAQ